MIDLRVRLCVCVVINKVVNTIGQHLHRHPVNKREMTQAAGPSHAFVAFMMYIKCTHILEYSKKPEF